ncbi:MAG: hypothetical protein HN353_01660 [Bdellovibrionales bacterium]|jgi:hypothetical protein|nr:hypothetical protein [Bdellovibrionales bacterium]MBT3525413.1 hypothetical protein [Bdellovibrionales bacterium]MBT7766264.1 hypothetical protein [Bdellovibrionales bacterium]
MSKVENSSAESGQVKVPESVVMTVKNFRSASDIDNFYRYINDNRLRREAKMILDTVVKAITPPKRRRRSKRVVH